MKIRLHASAKKEGGGGGGHENVSGFKISHFSRSFSSDIVAMRGLMD